jgi:hypothetical protein
MLPERWNIGGLNSRAAPPLFHLFQPIMWGEETAMHTLEKSRFVKLLFGLFVVFAGAWDYLLPGVSSPFELDTQLKLASVVITGIHRVGTTLVGVLILLAIVSKGASAAYRDVVHEITPESDKDDKPGVGE